MLTRTAGLAAALRALPPFAVVVLQAPWILLFVRGEGLLAGLSAAPIAALALSASSIRLLEEKDRRRDPSRLNPWGVA